MTKKIKIVNPDICEIKSYSLKSIELDNVKVKFVVVEMADKDNNNRIPYLNLTLSNVSDEMLKNLKQINLTSESEIDEDIKVNYISIYPEKTNVILPKSKPIIKK